MNIYPIKAKIVHFPADVNLYNIKIQKFTSGTKCWSEIQNCVTKLYPIKLTTNPNNQIDGIISNPPIVKFVSIKTLTKHGTCVYTSTRNNTLEKAYKFINKIDIFLYCDIKDAPIIKFIPITQNLIIEKITQGEIQPNKKISYNKFYELFSNLVSFTNQSNIKEISHLEV